MASTILFKDNQSVTSFSGRKGRWRGANDNMRHPGFSTGRALRNWRALMVFSSVIVAGAVLFVFPGI